MDQSMSSSPLPGMPGAAGAAAARHVVRKSMWSQDEDTVLREQVRVHGAKDWDKVCPALPGRTAKSCRLRWCQHLNPSMETVKPFTPEEDKLIVKYQAIHTNRWSTIARFLPGRTDNAVKNRWNSILRRHQAPYEQQPPRVPCAAGVGQAAADGVPTPECLPLFPLVSGDARGAWQGSPQVHFPVASEEGESEVESDAAMKCLELFPLTPGDIKDNASVAAFKDMSFGAGDPLTELRLGSEAMVVFDAMPLQA